MPQILEKINQLGLQQRHYSGGPKNPLEAAAVWVVASNSLALRVDLLAAEWKAKLEN